MSRVEPYVRTQFSRGAEDVAKAAQSVSGGEISGVQTARGGGGTSTSEYANLAMIHELKASCKFLSREIDDVKSDIREIRSKIESRFGVAVAVVIAASGAIITFILGGEK